MSIKRNSLIGVFSNVVIALSSFTLNVILARQLGPEGFGHYSYLIAFAGFFLPFLDFGLSSAYIVQGSRNREMVWLLTLRAIIIKLLLASLFLPVFLFAAWFFSDINLFVIIALLFFVLFQSLHTGLSAITFVAIEKVQYFYSTRVVYEVGLIIVLLCLIAREVNFNVQQAVMATAAASATALVFYFIVLWFNMPRTLKKKATVFPSNWKREFRYILPFSVYDFMLLLNYRTNVILLESFADSTEVAKYRVPFLFIQLLMFAVKAIGNAVFPRLAYYDRAKDQIRFRSLYLNLLKVFCFFVGLFLIQGMLFGHELIVFFFGSEYEFSEGTWQILCAAGGIMIVQAVFAGMMNFLGHEKLYAKQSVIAMIGQVGLSAGLVAPFGAEGVAVAVFLGAALFVAINYKYLSSIYDINIFDGMVMARYSLVVLCCFVVGYILNSYVFWVPMVVVAGLYFVLSVCFRCIPEIMLNEFIGRLRKWG